MKKKTYRTIALICLLSILLSVPAMAATTASYQFASYDLDPIYLSSGQIDIYLTINATGPMDMLGCKKIYVYEKIGSIWMLIASFDQDDPGMMDYDTFYFSVEKLCNAHENGEYKVEAVIYAKDYNGGSDTRTITTYVYT